jgi:pantetheine-phosphate adenylyltransferase
MVGRRHHPTVAVLGGTFDHLHAGHRALLTAAFRKADIVRIGVTTDDFARSERKPLPRRLESYATRRRHLNRFLEANFGKRDWTLTALRDRWGGSVRPGADLLILSEETRKAAAPILAERELRGLPKIRVYVIPQVNARDGRPISSRRIRAGEIDSEGNLRRPAKESVFSSSTKD